MRRRATRCSADWSVSSAGGHDGMWIINTLEGEMACRSGDYVIKGVAGEFYPCKPDIFAATYEPADGES